MSFLNAALAFGAAAFAIPLIIHLFFRSRFKTIEWGAMHLLENVVRVNRRRMRLTNLLLLLLRCAIPVILALCLARPVLTGFQALAGDAPKTLVIALDDSRSMAATPAGGTSRIESAKLQIRAVLDDLTRQDEVILVRSSRLSAVPAKMGVSDAAASLRKVAAQGGSVSMGRLMDAARDAAQMGTHTRRHVMLVSDFQSNSVESSTLDIARRIAESIAEDENTANQPVFDFLNVGGQSDELANVSVDRVAVDSPVVVSKRAGVYTATIRNSSELPANDLRLVWSIDGQPLDPRIVSVEAKSTSTNRLTHVIDSPGIHQVSVSVSRADVLTEDNLRSIAVEVIQEINVLLVDGRPSRDPLKGQADFLAIALSPFAFGGDDRPDPVRAAVVTESKLSKSLLDGDVRVVILAGVGRLADNSRSSLVDFVHRGGSLVVFDGDAIRPGLYDQAWKSNDSKLEFPAALGEIIRSEPENGFRLEPPSQMYQPWRILSRGDQNPLSDVSINQYRKLTLNVSSVTEAAGSPADPSADPSAENESDSDNASARQDAAPVVLIKTVQGDPVAVSSASGLGRVVQFAITGNDQWSNLPLRPVFLPLIQQMVLDLAGKQSDVMIDVGDPIVINDSDWPTLLEDFSDQTTANYFLETPLGKSELASPEDGEPLKLTSTYAPGLYRIEKRIRDPKNPQNETTAETIRIADIPAAESVLVDVQPSRLETVAEKLGATIFTDIDSLRSTDKTRSFGREIWRPLLVLLLIALIAELWLQQNLISNRRKGVTA